MCDAQDDEWEDGRDCAAVPPLLLEARTRAVEAGRPGEPVPEALWPVFFGTASGSIPWRHHARMLACQERAIALLRFAPARRGAAYRPAAPVCSA